MKKCGFLLIISLFLGGKCQALDLGFAKEDGGQAGAIFDAAANARALGMGEAQVAVANDASATYWNPANLSTLDRKDLVSMYSALQENTGYGFLGFAQPTLDYGSFGFGVLSLRSANFERRIDAVASGQFSQSETAFLFSHGFHLNDRLSFGESLKIIRQEIDSFSATGYGMDLSLLTSLTAKIQFGAVLQNILAPSLKLKNEADKYPRQLRLGLGFKPWEKWTFATDLDRSEKRSVKIHLGTEYQINKLIALRAGIQEAEVTVGMGFGFKDWGLDYALGYNDAASGFKDLGVSHRFGIHMTFGQKISEQGASLKWQKKGELVLELLEQKMDLAQRPPLEETEKLIDLGDKVIQHQGYVKPQNLYRAQGYIYYLKGDDTKSIQSLTEALALDPTDKVLIAHLDKVKAQLTEQQLNRELNHAKDLFSQGDYKGVLAACSTILAIRPDHVEAKAYIEDAQRRIDEPILRELKIAKAKIQQEEYLEAIRHLQKVKELDPNQPEAATLMAQAIEALEKKAGQLRPVEGGGDGKTRTRGVYELSADSKQSRDLYSRGLLMYSQGKLKEAVASWEKAVSLDSTNTLARNAYNRALTELKESH